ncbi:hypothetical protein KJ567_01605 [Candidatus Bipolaricaulota bacterium]|nr:hypothetical protein [Candidatus Bipolaricaulota bacterium]
MSMRCKTWTVRIVLFTVFWLSACTLSLPIDITGQWVGTLEYTSGPATGFIYPLTLNLIYNSRDVTGTITLVSHGPFTFDLPINSGRAKNPDIRLDAFGTNPHVVPSPTVSIALEGRYDAESMSGEGTQTVDGATYEFNWTASFVPPPAPPEGDS